MLALIVATLLAGCMTASGPAGPIDSSEPTTHSPNASAPTTGTSPDEPPLDFDGGDGTLGPEEPPHTVRLVNEGDMMRNVTLTVDRDGETVYEGTFRSFPNTTILGQIDHAGNYTLSISVVGNDGTVTETLARSSFDCNYSTTTFDLTGPEPTVRTVSTEMACGTASA
jgi:hypothetical protein